MTGEKTAHILVLSADLHLPAAQSLKAKRWVLKSLKDRIRKRFNVSIAEIDGQDKWQRAVFGICMVGNDRAQMDSAMAHLRALIEKESEVEVLRYHTEYL